jgi:hypothetical protein
MFLGVIPPRPAFGKINKNLVTYCVSATLDNRYHNNPQLVNCTPAQATHIVPSRAKLSEEDGAQLRANKSQCLSAWIQPEAYPYLKEWLTSKGLEIPSDVTSFLRFIGNGEKGLLGYVEFLLHLSIERHDNEDHGEIPTVLSSHDCCAAENHILHQRMETLKSTVADLQSDNLTFQDALKKVQALAESRKRLLDARRKDKRNANKRESRAAARMAISQGHVKKLKRKLGRRDDILRSTHAQQRTRKNMWDLKENGTTWRERVKDLRGAVAPEAISHIRQNNKKTRARKR